MVRSPLFGVRPHQLLGIKARAVQLVRPLGQFFTWSAATGVSGLGLLLKHLQIIRHRIRELLVVLAVWMVDIPIRFPVVIPDVGIDPISEVRVAGLFFPRISERFRSSTSTWPSFRFRMETRRAWVLICDDPRGRTGSLPDSTHRDAHSRLVLHRWRPDTLGQRSCEALARKVHIPSLDANNAPEIHGCSEGKHEAGKQDGGSRPPELAGFSVLEVGGASLAKKNTARIRSMAGNTTLSTTDLIWVDAVDQVLSTGASHIPWCLRQKLWSPSGRSLPRPRPASRSGAYS